MGVFEAIMAVVGIITTAMSAMSARAALQDQQDYNNQVAANEQQMVEQKVTFDDALLREQAEKTRARQRLSFLNSGVDISDGTPLAVLGDSASDTEMDAMAIRYSANIEKNKIKNANDLLKYKTEQQRGAVTMNAIGSVVGSMSKMGSSLMTDAGKSKPIVGGVRNDNTSAK